VISVARTDLWLHFLLPPVLCPPACRLAAERELALRLKGENAIVKKKFQVLQKDLEQQVR